MKNEKELAQMRVDVKRALRRKLSEITGQDLTSHILYTGRELFAGEYLLEGLERSAYKMNEKAEQLSYNSDLASRWLQYRDYIRELILWIKTSEEGQELANKWNLQADINTGKKANI